MERKPYYDVITYKDEPLSLYISSGSEPSDNGWRFHTIHFYIYRNQPMEISIEGYRGLLRDECTSRVRYATLQEALDSVVVELL